MSTGRKEFIPLVVSVIANAAFVLLLACVTLAPNVPRISSELVATVLPPEETLKKAQVDPVEEILKQAQKELSETSATSRDVPTAAIQAPPPALLKIAVPSFRPGQVGTAPSMPEGTGPTVVDVAPYIRPQPEVLVYQIAAQNGDEKLAAAIQHWTTYENGERRLEKGLRTIPKNSPIYAVLTKIQKYVELANKEWSSLPQSSSSGMGEREQDDGALERELNGIAGENQGNRSTYGVGADPLMKQNIVVVYDISNSMKDTGPKEQIASLQKKNNVRIITCASGLITSSKGGQNDYNADYELASDAIIAACRENRGRYTLIVVVSDFREKSEITDKLQEIARYLTASNLRLYLDTTLDMPRQNAVDLAKSSGGGIVKSFQVLAR